VHDVVIDLLSNVELGIDNDSQLALFERWKQLVSHPDRICVAVADEYVVFAIGHRHVARLSHGCIRSLEALPRQPYITLQATQSNRMAMYPLTPPQPPGPFCVVHTASEDR